MTNKVSVTTREMDFHRDNFRGAIFSPARGTACIHPRARAHVTAIPPAGVQFEARTVNFCSALRGCCGPRRMLCTRN